MEFETIIESTVKDKDSIALRKKVNESLIPYVVHYHNLALEGYFWGDYYRTLEDAMEGYVVRCKREGVHLSPQCNSCFERLNGVLGLIRVKYEEELAKIREGGA